MVSVEMVETQIVASAFSLALKQVVVTPDVRMDRLDVFNETTGESWQIYSGTTWTGRTPQIKANDRLKIRITYSNYGGPCGVRFDLQVVGAQTGTSGSKISTSVDQLSGPITGGYRDHWINMWSEPVSVAFWLVCIT